MVQFSNGRAVTFDIAIVPTIRSTYIFVRISNGFWQNGGHLSGIQILDFRSHWKSGPFATQPLFDYLISRLVRISDPH